MRTFLIGFLLLFGCLGFAQQSMNNDSVIKLVKAGMSEDVIVSTIEASSALYDISADALIALKSAGASDKVVSAVVAKASQKQQSTHKAAIDDLTASYKKFRNSVVTVLAEYGPAKGTGFFVDPNGLIITNQHVVSKSEWMAVQINEQTRLLAKVLAADPEKDVAILWVNLGSVPQVTPVVLLKPGEAPAEEGERVFTIGSPLHQSKVMTTGIVSKIEDRAIISDLNINHGNSGGPLFNSEGVVIGVTTFGDFSRQGGPGIAGIVRIEQALPVLNEARNKMGSLTAPSAAPLQLEPSTKFPISALKEVASEKKFDFKPYVFSAGDYDLAVITPVLKYRKLSDRVEAGRNKSKRNQHNAKAAQGTFEPLDDLKDWEEYLGEYDPVILIQASPKLTESFWSAFGRGMAASQGGYGGPARLHFKTDFYRMQLFCGEKEIVPLLPGKSERVLSVNNLAVRVTDATFDGLYEYPADAIRPQCGKVTLKIYSEKDPNQPKTKELESKTVEAVFRDFAPYRAQEGLN